MMKKLYKKLSLTAVILLVLTSVGLAQERVVSGTVTDESGGGMPGVNVLLKGTSTGTTTDVEGNFKISVSGGDQATLTFTFVGYATAEIIVGSRSVVNIQLTPDVQTLTELVVTGYAVQEKKDITGAVGVVKSSDLVSVPAANTDQMLQGRVSGITVVGSGVPGQASIIRIRGFSALQGNSAPLYVVDGTPTYDIGIFNPYDIESITVLKDAGAASIYGARAANGVIVVTTKKGVKDGKLRVTYDSYYSWQDPGKGFTNLLNSQDQANLEWLVNKNDGTANDSKMYGSGATPVLPDYITPSKGYTGPVGPGEDVDPTRYNIDYSKGPIYQVVKANKQGTDWYDELTSKALMQTHNIALGGNGDNSKFFVGLNYFDQKGIILNTYTKRLSLRANSEFNIKNKVRIGEHLLVSYSNGPGFTNLSEGNAISNSYRLQRIVPVYDEFGGFAGSNGQGLGNGNNPVANQARTKNNKGFSLTAFGNVYAEADIMKGVTFKTTLGGSLTNYYFYGFNYRSYENSENPPSNSYYEGSGFASQWHWTNTVTAKRTFGQHNVTVVAGTEAVEQGIGRQMNASRNSYFSLNPNSWSLNAGASALNNSGEPNTPSTLFSLFARADYGFNDKYLLSATVRRDGSSKFGADSKYGVFPSITAGWRISGENFMQSVSAINDLKIRAGWGQMGSDQNISSSNQYSQFGGSVTQTAYDINGTNSGSAQGFRQTQLGNASTQWETNETSNIGIDATILDSKLDISVDVYKKVTKDLLYRPELIGVAGFAQGPSINVGQMTNSGIDLSLTYRTKIANDWSLEINGTLTAYKNNIDKIANGYSYFDQNSGEQGRLGDIFVRNAVGHQISSFYGYKVIGMNQSADTVGLKNPTTGVYDLKQEGGLPGTLKFADTNGDGKITVEDKQYLGSALPKFTYGLNINASYKNFDLTVFLYGSQGNSIMNYTKWWTDFPSSFAGAKSDAALNDSWTRENTSGTTPMASKNANYASISTNKSSNSYYLEDGSYLRVRNIMLAYNLPSSIISRIGMHKAKVYVQGVNLFTFTKYSGLNPELGGSDQSFGIDFGSYPIPKQYTIGLSVSF